MKIFFLILVFPIYKVQMEGFKSRTSAMEAPIQINQNIMFVSVRCVAMGPTSCALVHLGCNMLLSIPG